MRPLTNRSDVPLIDSKRRDIQDGIVAKKQQTWIEGDVTHLDAKLTMVLLCFQERVNDVRSSDPKRPHPSVKKEQAPVTDNHVLGRSETIVPKKPGGTIVRHLDELIGVARKDQSPTFFFTGRHSPHSA